MYKVVGTMFWLEIFNWDIVHCYDKYFELEDVEILKGVVSKNHVHMHVEYSLSLSISGFVKKLKAKSQGNYNEIFQVWGIDIGVGTFGQLDMDVGVQEILQMKWLMSI